MALEDSVCLPQFWRVVVRLEDRLVLFGMIIESKSKLE